MAYPKLTIRHGVLTGATVHEVDLSGDHKSVEVLNRTGTAEIFFTVDGPNPTVAGDDTYIVPAAITSTKAPAPGSGDTKVRLISSGAMSYSVIGVPN